MGCGCRGECGGGFREECREECRRGFGCNCCWILIILLLCCCSGFGGYRCGYGCGYGPKC